MGAAIQFDSFLLGAPHADAMASEGVRYNSLLIDIQSGFQFIQSRKCTKGVFINTLMGGGGRWKIWGGQKSFEASKRVVKKVSNSQRGVKKQTPKRGGQKSLNIHRFSKFPGAYLYTHTSVELEYFC